MDTKRIIFLLAAASLTVSAEAKDMESAREAVDAMRLGWNLGNTLDVHSDVIDNMWLEAWTEGTPKDYETAWGQPVTQPELFKMFKDAGFNAIRVPVTWYPHMSLKVDVGPDASGDYKAVWDREAWPDDAKVDEVWMARVKEVVDYVLAQDMYCILNVHHDTGASTTAWLRASEEEYGKNHLRFENLWKQIAEEFKDYDGRLLFEGYNEMLDPYSSWCFASFACPGNYNAAVAESAYKAINSYAQSFVDAVRSTGGNNKERNLIVNTYGACSGAGDWNSHLSEPLDRMSIPKDEADGHLIAEIHGYFNAEDEQRCKSEMDGTIKLAKDKLESQGVPVIFGEWGVNIDGDGTQANMEKMARYFVEETKKNGIGTFYWMTLSDGDDRTAPRWTNPGLKSAIEKGFYGEEGYSGTGEISVAKDEGLIFNLQGIRVEGMTEAGWYIRGGKKIIYMPK